MTTSTFDPNNVKALVFDVFGTVVDWRGSIAAEGEARWASRVPGVDWAAFADAWRAQYGPTMNKVRTGELPWSSLDVLHRLILDDIAPQFGLTGLSEAEMDDLNRIWHRLHGWPDSPSGLTRLKSKYIISTLSNGNLGLLTEMGKFAGLPWDCILSSDLFGHFKPDPEVYLGAANLLGLRPDQVMMTAAHTNDLNSAAKLGLRTAYVHRPTEAGTAPGRERTMPAADAYDCATSSFEELADVLGCK
jgi:2-haloacid dehalogenase